MNDVVGRMLAGGDVMVYRLHKVLLLDTVFTRKLIFAKGLAIRFDCFDHSLLCVFNAVGGVLGYHRAGNGGAGLGCGCGLER